MAGRRNTPTGRSAGAKAGAATKRRQEFEAANPDRMATISDQQFSEHKTFGESGVSPKMAYHLLGLHDQEPKSPHPHGQMELPGMTSRRTGIESGLISRHAATTLPDLAPAPAPWHEMSAEDQNHTLAHLRRFGVTPESMHRSFGAQLDQGHLRAREHGMTPFASHFYSGSDPDRPSTPEEMQPRDRLMESAHNNDVPFSTQVLANAKTSPKAKFREVRGGVVRYPNDEGANIAVQGVKRGLSDEQIKASKPSDLAITATNIGLAAHTARQHLAGTPLDEVRNPPSKTAPHGSEPFGPKTGPYANSFIDPHGSSQFFVSDVHSGGAGMAPHVPHEAPFVRLPEDERHLFRKGSGGKGKVESVGPDHPEWDSASKFALTSSGKPKRLSSAREKMIEVPGFHSLANHVAQNVIRERGLNSLSGAQATQWGEEQVSRGEVDRGARKVTLVSEGDAYRKQPLREEVHGQMDIFGGEAHTGSRGAHVRPMNVTEMPEGKERVKAEAAASAIQRNTVAKRRRQGRTTPTYKDLGNEPYEGWG